MSSVDYLLSPSGEREHQQQGCVYRFRYVRIIPSVGLVLIGMVISSYVVTEWTHHKVSTDNCQNVRNESFEVSNFSCGTTNSKAHANCVQQQTAAYVMYYNIALHIPAFFASIILPARTDAHGRKFLLILAASGLCFKIVCVAVVIKFNSTLLIIVILNAVDGFTGSIFTLTTAIFSYIADVTPNNNQRVMAVVILETVMMVTGTFSGLIAGYLISAIDYSNAAFVCSAITLSGLFLMFFLSESLSEQNRRQASSLLHSFKDMTQFYVSKDFAGLRMRYILLILMFLINELSLDDRSALETIVLLGKPFCWKPSKIGIFSMVRHGAQSFIGMGSVKFLQKCMTNPAIASLSILSNVASYILEAFATSDLTIFIVATISVFGTVIFPIVRAMMSEITPQNKQGAMFAGVGCVDVICSISSSVIWNEVYANTLSFMNGFVFLAMAGCCIIHMVLLCVFCCIQVPKRPILSEEQIPLISHVENAAFC